MTQDEITRDALMKRLEELPEDAEIPDELLDKMSQDQLIAVFAEKMINDKGIEPTDELRTKVINEINDNIDEKIFASLPDYLVDRLKNGFENNMSEDEVNKILDESGIDIDTITQDAMIDYRNKFLAEKEEA